MRVGDVLPFEELYLIKSDGQWPVRAEVHQLHAISTIRTKMSEDRYQRVRVWRVVSIEVEELELQTEVVREELVPYGTSVRE